MPCQIKHVISAGRKVGGVGGGGGGARTKLSQFFNV